MRWLHCYMRSVPKKRRLHELSPIPHMRPHVLFSYLFQWNASVAIYYCVVCRLYHFCHEATLHVLPFHLERKLAANGFIRVIILRVHWTRIPGGVHTKYAFASVKRFVLFGTFACTGCIPNMHGLSYRRHHHSHHVHMIVQLTAQLAHICAGCYYGRFNGIWSLIFGQAVHYFLAALICFSAAIRIVQGRTVFL